MVFWGTGRGTCLAVEEHERLRRLEARVPAQRSVELGRERGRGSGRGRMSEREREGERRREREGERDFWALRKGLQIWHFAGLRNKLMSMR